MNGGRHSSSCADVVGDGGDVNTAMEVSGYAGGSKEPTKDIGGACGGFIGEFYKATKVFPLSSVPGTLSQIQFCVNKFDTTVDANVDYVLSKVEADELLCDGFSGFDECDGFMTELSASGTASGFAYTKQRVIKSMLAATDFFSYDICNAFTAEQKALFAQQMAEYTCQMEADCIGGTCLQDDGPRAPALLVQGSAECIKPGDPTAPGKVIDSGEEGTTLIECNKDARAGGFDYFLFKEGGDCFFVDLTDADCSQTIYNEHFDLYKTTSGRKNSGKGDAAFYQPNNKGNFWCNVRSPNACTDAVKDFNYGDGLYGRKKSYEICDAFAAAAAAAEADAAAAMAQQKPRKFVRLK